MTLTKQDTIVTAFADHATGSGWINDVVWVIVRGKNGVLREECLQQDEQSAEMQFLFNVSRAVHLSMSRAVAKIPFPGVGRGVTP